MQWDTLHYTTDGVTWEEEALNSDNLEVVDWKRPAFVDVLVDDVVVASDNPW